MKIGTTAPIGGPQASPENLTRFALEAERLGFDSLTFSDHIIIPADIHARYPYSETGEFPRASRGERHEQLTAIAFVAAKTSRIRFLTAVMVVPHRPAVLTAKILATIDVLSGGRLSVGCGAGWLKEEFEAIGAPPFEKRGVATDEYIRAFRELWTKEAPRFDGQYVNFRDITFAPKPVQKPHPPILVGGESGPALRRAARLGDGWYPIGVNPEFPLDTLSRYRARIDDLRAEIRAAGRNAADVTLGYRCHLHGDAVQPKTVEGERRLFSGGTRDIAGDIRALRELGVEQVDFGLLGPTIEASLDNLRRFRDEVIAHI